MRLAGQERICLLCDESDLNVQSASGDEGETEKILSPRRDRAFQVVGFAATVSAHALTLGSKRRVLDVDTPRNYFGFSCSVQAHPRLQRIQVMKENGVRKNGFQYGTCYSDSYGYTLLAEVHQMDQGWTL